MLKKLKSLFVVEDENETSAKEAASKPQPASKKNTVSADAKAPIIDPAKMDIPEGTKPTAKFIDVLLKAIDNANQDGFDYLEFKQSFQSLKGVTMDDKTRYQSALAMAKTMGATPDKLVKSANHYLDVLKAENQKFSQALKNQRSKQITSKQDEVKRLELQIKQKHEKIEALKKEIAQSEKQLATAKKSMDGAAAKVENTKKGFAVAYLSVSGQINEDLDKIKQYA